jgi:hypothetical protein
MEVRVGLVIAGEDFLFRVPSELASHPPGNVTHVANGGGAVSDLHIGVRLFTRLYAVEPVL